MAVTPKRRSARPERRTFVLDTSVLLADPAAITRFDEHEVVIPLVVVSELEGKRHHPELGYFARSALRMLDELRVKHGRLDAPIPVGTAEGTLRVELNHTDFLFSYALAMPATVRQRIHAAMPCATPIASVETPMETSETRMATSERAGRIAQSAPTR